MADNVISESGGVNESKDVEDMMAVLAQMEEKAKNMERLVLLKRQEREQIENKNENENEKTPQQAMDDEEKEIQIIEDEGLMLATINKMLEK